MNTEGHSTYKIGDKVRIVKNFDPKYKSFIGKYGKVAGAITDFSCRVKLAYDGEFWFDNRELEVDTAKHSG